MNSQLYSEFNFFDRIKNRVYMRKNVELFNYNKKYCVFDIGSDKVVCILFKIEKKKPFIIGMDHQKKFWIFKRIFS